MRHDGRGPGIAPMAARQWLLLALAPLLLWPAMVNGGAFFFPDTPAYVRSIDALAVRVAGHASDWTTPRAIQIAGPSRGRATVRAAAMQPTNPADASAPILVGRSPFYGALAYLGVLTGTFWTVLAVQALAAMAVLIAALRHAIDPTNRRAFALAAAGAALVAALTPLAYFTAMLTPDIFAGLGIIAGAMLLGGWRRETKAGRIGWALVAGYGALSHSATTLILLALCGLATLVWIVRRRLAAPGVAIAAVAGAALLGLAGDTTFAMTVEQATGQPPIRPPFITARLTADGVGTAYARAHCATARWVLCRYVDRLPLHSDSFLWSGDPRTGVFMTLPPAEQRALSAEQMPFLLAVLRDRPWETLATSWRAIIEQLGAGGLSEFRYTPDEYQSFVEKMPPALVAALRDTAAYRGTMPIAFVEALAWPFVALTIALTLWATTRPTLRAHATIAAWVIVGWLVNDAICGGLSTPHDRYHMRVIWTLPIVAMLIVVAAVAERRRRRPRVTAFA